MRVHFDTNSCTADAFLAGGIDCANDNEDGARDWVTIGEAASDVVAMLLRSDDDRP